MNVLPHAYLSDSWREYRQTRITGSTAAAVLGLSKYSSPLYEWARIKGNTTRSDDTNAYASWGMATEAAHRLWLAQEGHGDVWEAHGIVQHPDYPWACSTPDGFVGDDGTPEIMLIELKAPSQWTMAEWRGELPLPYQVQAQFNMACAGVFQSHLSAILPPEKDPGASFVRYAAKLTECATREVVVTRADSLRFMQESGFRRVGFDLPANKRFQDAMFAKLATFMDENVRQGFQPEATGLSCDKDVLKGLGGEILNTDFDEKAVEKWDALEVVNSTLKKLDERKQELQNQLTQAAKAATWTDAKKALNRARKETA